MPLKTSKNAKRLNNKGLRLFPQIPMPAWSGPVPTLVRGKWQFGLPKVAVWYGVTGGLGCPKREKDGQKVGENGYQSPALRHTEWQNPEKQGISAAKKVYFLFLNFLFYSYLCRQK